MQEEITNEVEIALTALRKGFSEQMATFKHMTLYNIEDTCLCISPNSSLDNIPYINKLFKVLHELDWFTKFTHIMRYIPVCSDFVEYTDYINLDCIYSYGYKEVEGIVRSVVNLIIIAPAEMLAKKSVQFASKGSRTLEVMIKIEEFMEFMVKMMGEYRLLCFVGYIEYMSSCDIATTKLCNIPDVIDDTCIVRSMQIEYCARCKLTKEQCRLLTDGIDWYCSYTCRMLCILKYLGHA